jgi:hypothetical protein
MTISPLSQEAAANPGVKASAATLAAFNRVFIWFLPKYLSKTRRSDSLDYKSGLEIPQRKTSREIIFIFINSLCVNPAGDKNVVRIFGQSDLHLGGPPVVDVNHSNSPQIAGF